MTLSSLEWQVICLPYDCYLRGAWLWEDDVRKRQIHETVLVVLSWTLHHYFDEFNGDLWQGEKLIPKVLYRGRVLRFAQLPSSYENLMEQKKVFTKQKGSTATGLFGTPTWPPFYCFRTQIWRTWCHVKTFGSLYVSGKLPTYPSPKPTLTLTFHLGENVGLGEG